MTSSPPGQPAPSELDPEQRAWLEADEALWRRAHRICASHPELDVGDVYHTLRNLLRTPSERLRRGLRDGRARTSAR
ncbi:MAG: hypothetical protein FJ104_00950 [Deltaproteobacteria bacterium]|nr:hypothetical protein [Deltaproteobacteria bacterium]